MTVFQNEKLVGVGWIVLSGGNSSGENVNKNDKEWFKNKLVQIAVEKCRYLYK